MVFAILLLLHRLFGKVKLKGLEKTPAKSFKSWYLYNNFTLGFEC